MNKLFLIPCTAIALGVVSCGSAGKKSDSGSNDADKAIADTVASAYTLSDEGIGGIVLGMRASDIPDSVAGLYSHVEKYEGKSFIGYSFVMDSIETFKAEDTDFDGKVNLISLSGESSLKAASGNGLVYIGMSESDLLDPKGDTLVAKEDGVYRIGNIKVQVQDGKVSEIYIEYDPITNK